MAHHDFDADPRFAGTTTFQMCGHTFTLRDDVDPAAFFEYDTMTPTMSSEDALNVLDQVVTACVVEADEPVYRALRAQRRIGLKRLSALVVYLIGEMTGRDPSTPTSSSATPAGGGQSSTGTSPSTVVPMRASSMPGGS